MTNWIICVKAENWDLCKETGLHAFGDKAVHISTKIKPDDTILTWMPKVLGGRGAVVAVLKTATVAVQGTFVSPWPDYTDPKVILGIKDIKEFTTPVPDTWSWTEDASHIYGIKKSALQTGLQEVSTETVLAIILKGL